MKKNKNIKYETEEQKEVKKFIFVVIGLVIVIIGVYLFTKAFVTKDLFDDKNNTDYTEGIINYDTAIVGNMLNRPYAEYYLIAFDSKSLQQNYYSTLISKYKSNEKSLKVYQIDLSNELNKQYKAQDGNESKNFESIDKLKLGEVTLIKVKNKKVTKFVTNLDEIAKELTIES